jgi:hypothetical protein
MKPGPQDHWDPVLMGVLGRPGEQESLVGHVTVLPTGECGSKENWSYGAES